MITRPETLDRVPEHIAIERTDNRKKPNPTPPMLKVASETIGTDEMTVSEATEFMGLKGGRFRPWDYDYPFSMIFKLVRGQRMRVLKKREVDEFLALYEEGKVKKKYVIRREKAKKEKENK